MPYGRSLRTPGRSQAMNLEDAFDRLLRQSWLPQNDIDLEHLPDGRAFPSVLSIQREFSNAGLELSIKHNLIFNCYRATWGPAGEPLDPSHAADERHGTVVG